MGTVFAPGAAKRARRNMLSMIVDFPTADERRSHLVS